MGKLKRIFGILLVVAVALSSVVIPAYADFTDVDSNASYDDAVNTLNKLGIINGYEDGSFKPQNNVTRAEFTAMLLRTRGLGSTGSTSLDNPPFPDVVSSDVSWAIGNIRTAQGMGIINGYEDGTFRPNNNVSYEEAVKMIVCALGYGEFQPEGSEWYSKYISTATNLGFLKKADGSIGNPATRSCIAQMLYDCLEIKLAENNEITNKTMLNDDLKITKNTGKISANTITSLDSPDVQTKAGEIQIYAKEPDTGDYETHTYKTSDTAAYNNLLGYEVTYYYKYDRNADTRDIIFIEVNKGNVIEINAKDVEINSCTNSAIGYYKSEDASSTTKASIDAESIVIYNDKLYGDDASDSRFDTSMIPEVGRIKLLDSDSNGTYDVLFIDKYETYVVSTTTSSTYTIVDETTKATNSDRKKIDLDPDNGDVRIVDQDGNNVDFSSIAKWNVVCVKTSHENVGTLLTTAVVCKKSVTGKITSIKKGDSIIINDTTYSYSPAAPWVSTASDLSDLEEPSLSDVGTYYLDLNGDIIVYDKTSTASNQMYGYIMKTIPGEDNFEETLRFKILTQGNSTVQYSAYKNTKVNGKTFSTFSELQEALAESASIQNTDEDNSAATYTQLVKFTTKTYDGETVIDEFITADALDSTEGAKVDSETLTMYETINAQSMKYTSSNKQLSGGGTTVNISGAYVFVVPSNRNESDGYRLGGLSDFKNGSSYYVEAFDISSSHTAKAVVLYGANATTEVDATTPAYLITDIGQAQNDSNDGEAMWKISGYNGKSPFEVWGSPDSEDIISELEPGDIVRFGKDNDGYSTLNEEDILWSNGKSADYGSDDTVASERNNYDSEFKFIWGSVCSIDDGYIVVTRELLEEDDQYKASSEDLSISRDNFGGARILEYNTGKSPIEITDVTGDGVDSMASKLSVYNGVSTPAHVFAYMSNGSVRLFVIVE